MRSLHVKGYSTYFSGQHFVGAFTTSRKFCIVNDNDNEMFFIDIKLHKVHSIYKTTHM